MREEKYICDICDKDIEENKRYVVKMAWINQRKDYDYDLCESCRDEVRSMVPADHKPKDGSDHSFFKAMLRLFHKKQGGK